MIEQATIGGLIVWITARLFIFERGPFALFERWRYLLGIRLDEFGNPTARDGELQYVFSCLTCLSFWLAVLVALYFHSPLYMILVYTGISVALNRITN